VPLLVALVLWVDRLEPEPRGPLIFAFAWGAGIAALAALIINTAGLEYVTQPALGASTGEYVSATFGAPVVEETLKGLVLVGLLWRRRDELDGPTDGVIYAAMVGLGFAMIENVGYYINALVTPQRGGIALLGYTFVLRGLFSPLLHPLFTSMTGLGVAYAANRRRGGGWAVVVGWLAAMLLHGIWNGLSVYGTAGVLIGYAIMSCVLAGVIAVLVADRHRIVGLIRHDLPAYAATGLVTSDDIAMLSSMRARRQARNWARARGGMAASAAMSDYQLAATELALLHGKADRGVIDRRTFVARQHDLLALMHIARRSFARRSYASTRPVQPHAPWAPPGASAFAPGRHVLYPERARGDSRQKRRSPTLVTEWSASLCRTRVALARVGWMFSTRLTSLIVFQTSAPNASTSARLTSASARNGDRGSVNAVSRSARSRARNHCSMSSVRAST
jgi:protease PrsW